MRFISRALLAAGLAVVVRTTLGGSASAQSLSLDPGGAITATSVGRLTSMFGSSVDLVNCDVQLRGSLVSTPVPKASGERIGAITGTSILNCALGVSLTPLSLPWDVEYNSISGTLPDSIISIGIGIARTQFQINNVPMTGTCLYEGPFTGAVPLSGSNPYTTSGTIANARFDLAKVSGSPIGLCANTGYVAGSLDLRPTQTITRL